MKNFGAGHFDCLHAPGHLAANSVTTGPAGFVTKHTGLSSPFYSTLIASYLATTLLPGSSYSSLHTSQVAYGRPPIHLQPAHRVYQYGVHPSPQGPRPQRFSKGKPWYSPVRTLANNVQPRIWRGSDIRLQLSGRHGHLISPASWLRKHSFELQTFLL